MGFKYSLGAVTPLSLCFLTCPRETGSPDLHLFQGEGEVKTLGT